MLVELTCKNPILSQFVRAVTPAICKLSFILGQQAKNGTCWQLCAHIEFPFLVTTQKDSATVMSGINDLLPSFTTLPHIPNQEFENCFYFCCLKEHCPVHVSKFKDKNLRP